MGLCGVANPQLPLLIVCLFMSINIWWKRNTSCSDDYYYTTVTQFWFRLELCYYQKSLYFSNFSCSFLYIGPSERGGVVDNNTSLLSLARGIAFRPCCKRLCMWQGRSDTTIMEMTTQLVLSCSEEIYNMSKKEKLQYIRLLLLYTFLLHQYQRTYFLD